MRFRICNMFVKGDVWGGFGLSSVSFVSNKGKFLPSRNEFRKMS